MRTAEMKAARIAFRYVNATALREIFYRIVPSPSVLKGAITSAGGCDELLIYRIALRSDVASSADSLAGF
jgi:hypothetical protein